MVFYQEQVNQWLGALATATAPVKVIAFFLCWVVAWLPIVIPLAIIIKWHPFQPLTEKQKLPLLASLYLIAPLIVWATISLEGISFADYGVVWDTQFFLSLGWGLVLGVIGLAVIFAGESLLGWIEWRKENLQRLWKLLIPLTLVGLWIGITEEVIFRGFLLNELQQDYSIWLAAIISSIIFALLHLVWEQKDTLPQLPGLWLMGMVLVLSRWSNTGSLGIAWGLHAGWILGLSCLDSAELISYTGKGSEWLTGIGKKPLAGAVGILCLLGTGSILWLMAAY